MMRLLFDCGIFAPIDARRGVYFQLSGTYLSSNGSGNGLSHRIQDSRCQGFSNSVICIPGPQRKARIERQTGKIDVMWTVVVRLEAQTASFFSVAACFTADLRVLRRKERPLDWEQLVCCMIWTLFLPY
jgi:hypothetical protein